MSEEKLHEGIIAAKQRIEKHVRRTPLDWSAFLSERCGANVYLKLESEQLGGSFKARGAFNKLCLLVEEDGEQTRRNPPLSASTGNHALACAYAMKKLNVDGCIYMPKNVSPAKDAAVRRMGVKVEYFGLDCVEGEMEARRVAQAQGKVFISPYNDIDVMCGQGTMAVEILEDLPKADAVFVAVGGGGMIGGVAAYIKAVKPDCKVIGCSPSRNKAMHESVKAGKVIQVECLDTLSDGTAGNIENNAVTFDVCQKSVDEWVLVEEDEIACAMYQMLEHHHKIVEGAAGVAIAGYIKHCEKWRGKNVVLVVCGGNVGVDVIKRIIYRDNMASCLQG